MCGSPLAPARPGRETRKIVSLLFIDIIGSTAMAERLDPEALRLVIDEFFAACAQSVAAHGGQVEKFIGDAVLAVFGARVSHEDDAVRAVRAGLDAVSALGEINARLADTHRETLDARCGVGTGEVIVDSAVGVGFRVVGDAVNTASRLQNAAPVGQILVDATTASLVRGHVSLVPVDPLTLKGKSGQVPAWRVAAGSGDRQPQDVGPPAVPMIGRTTELAELERIYHRVVRDQEGRLTTIIGPPGIGKSRLVREFLATLPSGSGPTVLAGRCSSYGQGITYKPLAEALRSYPGGWPALSRALEAAPGAAGGVPAAERLATIVEPATRPDAIDHPIDVEELAWAARFCLAAVSRAGPIVIIWEDLNWAEQTLLDLIENIATWLTGVPVLQICVARTELLESRPSWAAERPGATTLELAPLSAEESAELVGALASQGDVVAHFHDETLTRMSEKCDGIPLFAELLVDVVTSGRPGMNIPPTIGAVLGARLDQLPPDERRLLEQASVLGPRFALRPLSVLAASGGVPSETASALISRLLRRRVIEPADGPGSYRFAQSLVCDAAYGAAPKGRREQWHLVMAGWLAGEEPAGDGAGSLDLVYHVEAAMRLRRQLRPGDTTRPWPARQAAAELISEGMRALARRDLPAGASLLERCQELLAAGDQRHVSVAIRIADACIDLWQRDRALAALAAARRALPDDPDAHAACEIQELIVALRLGAAEPEAVRERADGLAATVGRAPSRDLSWGRLRQLQAYLSLADERAGDALTAFGRSLDHARAAGDQYEQERILCACCELAQWSPRPISEGLALCDDLATRFAARRALLIPVLLTKVRLEGLTGDLAAARQTLAALFEHARDLRLDLAWAATLDAAGFLDMLDESPATACGWYRQAADVLQANGQQRDAQTLRVAVARALLARNRPAEAAEELSAAEAGPAPDARTRIMMLALRGRLTALDPAGPRLDHRQPPLAITLARQAVALGQRTQDLVLQGDADLDLAEVLRACGREADARAAARRAAEKYGRKGALLLARRARAWRRRPAGNT
jgi:class 3 adenylate cyclase